MQCLFTFFKMSNSLERDKNIKSILICEKFNVLINLKGMKKYMLYVKSTKSKYYI